MSSRGRGRGVGAGVEVGAGIMGLVKVIIQGIVLGWKVESNWTNPFVFLTYMVAKPIAGVVLVGLVFIVGSIASIDKELFLHVFIGAVFFIYPANIVIALAYLVHEDRAKYEVLKHIYIAPLSLKPYIVGRGIASAINSSISVLISLLIGLLIFNNYFALDVAIDPLKIDYIMLITCIIVAVTSFISLGMILYAINLVTFKLQFSISEYTTGILFLLSGVVFPTSMLPYPFDIFTEALPTKHFLNLARASILGINDYHSVVLLVSTTLVLSFIAVASMHLIERKARIKGTIDRKAEY